MNNLKQLLDMLQLQARMNSKINPEWMTAGYDYLRAAAVEGAEALESLGWKWWKKQEPDMANVQIELVDIWHFLLSEAIRQHGSVEVAADFLLYPDCQEDSVPNPMPFPAKLYYELYASVNSAEHMTAQQRMELLIGLCALRAPLSQIVSVFNAILTVDAEMSDDELYAGYVSKNVLNFFRQDHGYKAGTYRKNWTLDTQTTVEDNVVMTRLATKLIAGGNFSETTLYDALSAYYIEVCAFATRHLACEDDAASDNSYQLNP